MVLQYKFVFSSQLEFLILTEMSTMQLSKEKTALVHYACIYVYMYHKIPSMYETTF